MKKILFFAILCTGSLVAQSGLRITYDVFIFDNKTTDNAMIYERNILETTASASVYKIFQKDTIFSDDNLGDFSSVKTDIARVQYKFLKDSLYVHEGLYLQKKVISDKGYSPIWRIVTGSKTILGYKCIEATTSWRGRDYVAYFTPDIPIKNGPYKFDNLPGLILEVISTDNVVQIKSKTVEAGDFKISNPFQDMATLSWSEYLAFYKKVYDKFLNYSPSADATITIPKRYLETYVQ